MIDHQTDPELLRRFASDQDPEAFAALVARYYGVVTGIGRRVLGDAHEAEDIAQSTFILLAEKAGGLTKKTSAELSRWIVGAAYRFAKNRRRQLGSRRSREEEFARRQENQVDHGVAETVATVDDAIARLPRDLRDTVIARYLRGLSYRETALELHIPTDTVRGRLARAKQLLKKQLATAGILTSLRNSDAAAPSEFTSYVISQARPSMSLRLPGAGLVGAGGLLALCAVGTWLFTSREAQPGSRPPETAAPRLVADVVIENTPAEEWAELIRSRLTGSLAQQRRNVAASDNAFDTLERLSVSWRELTSELTQEDISFIEAIVRGDKRWDDELVTGFLDSGVEALALFDQVLDYPDLQFPEIEFDGSIPYLVACWVPRTLVGLEAERAIQEGDINGGLQRLLDQWDFGEKVCGGQGAIIHFVAGNTNVRNAKEKIADIFETHSGELTASDLKLFQERLSAVASGRDFMVDAQKCEYIGVLKYIGRCLSGDVSFGKLLVDADSGKRNDIDIEELDRVLRTADLPKLLARIDEMHETFRDWLAAPVRPIHYRSETTVNIPDTVEGYSSITSEQAALMVAGQLTNLFGGNYPESNAFNNILATRVAFERAWRDGNEIRKLDDLVPAYLDDIPIDPYDGKPLRFDAEKRIIYSIGQDRIDSSGATEKEGAMRDSNEIVIQLPTR